MYPFLLQVDTVRIIYDGGRPKGYAYVDFKTREALLDALTYHEKVNISLRHLSVATVLSN